MDAYTANSHEMGGNSLWSSAPQLTLCFLLGACVAVGPSRGRVGELDADARVVVVEAINDATEALLTGRGRELVGQEVAVAPVRSFAPEAWFAGLHLEVLGFDASFRETCAVEQARALRAAGVLVVEDEQEATLLVRTRLQVLTGLADYRGNHAVAVDGPYRSQDWVEVLVSVTVHDSASGAVLFEGGGAANAEHEHQFTLEGDRSFDRIVAAVAGEAGAACLEAQRTGVPMGPFFVVPSVGSLRQRHAEFVDWRSEQANFNWHSKDTIEGLPTVPPPDLEDRLRGAVLLELKEKCGVPAMVDPDPAFLDPVLAVAHAETSNASYLLQIRTLIEERTGDQETVLLTLQSDLIRVSDRKSVTQRTSSYVLERSDCRLCLHAKLAGLVRSSPP